jgi:hypothetical protein
MAAPAATARGVPGGKPLKEGYKCLITMALNATFELYEISVTPPSMTNGDEIDTTTQHNIQFTTKAPRGSYEATPLLDYGETSSKCGYDPIVYNGAKSHMGKETTITKEWADGSTLAFFGYLKSLDFDEESRGEFPTCTAVFMQTNWDPTGKVEAGPTYVGVVGT